MNILLLYIVVFINTLFNLLGGLWLYNQLNADQWNRLVITISSIQLILLILSLL